MFQIVLLIAFCLLIPLGIYRGRKWDRWSWYTVKYYLGRKTFGPTFPCEVTSRCRQSVSRHVADDPSIIVKSIEPGQKRERSFWLNLICPTPPKYNRNGNYDEVVTVACRPHETNFLDKEVRISLVSEIDKLMSHVDDIRPDGSVDVVDQSLNAMPDGTWIAADYDCKELRFSSPINNIPTAECTKLVPLLSQVFGKMLPLFERLLSASLADEKSVRVYVKIKVYNVGEEAVEGTFHKEGSDREGICALGLYWPHIDKELSGGDIELQMPVPFMENDYENRVWYSGQHVVKTIIPVAENSVIAFSNDGVLHRMTRLTTRGKRYVVGFFLVKPWSNHIASSSKNAVNTSLQSGVDYTSAKNRRNLERDIKRGTNQEKLLPSCVNQGYIPSSD